MEFKDFVVTPIVLSLVFLVAYYLRPFLTSSKTRKYFIPALSLKIIGALSIGIIYQFYYNGGGDTFAYYDQAKKIHTAFYEDPVVGFQLMTYSGDNLSEIVEKNPKTFKYASNIYWFGAKSEYLVIRIIAFLGLFCAHTYSSIAVLFAFFSFFGMWVVYRTFLKLYPNLTLRFAIAFLFLPSVIFWGSGILKDTITISAVGWLIYASYGLFIERKNKLVLALIILVALYAIYVVKLYILLAIIPSILLWIMLMLKNKIRNSLIRAIVAPAFVAISLILGFFAINSLSAGNREYDLNKIGARTKINAEYIYYISNKDEGSGYYLGKMDGTIQGLVPLIPAALNVTIFRPYIWEVENPLMLLSSLEATFFLIMTLSLFFKPGILETFRRIVSNNTLIFCFLFALIMATAVGLNSYNFGSLSRYKITLLPFYLAGIFILKSKYFKSPKKLRKYVFIDPPIALNR